MTRRMDDFAFTRYSTPALACSFVSDSSILPLSRRTNHLCPIWGGGRVTLTSASLPLNPA